VSEEMTLARELWVEEQVARDLVERARSGGAQLVGPGGLLGGLTKTVWPTTIDDPLEARSQRLRNHLRRPNPSQRQLTEARVLTPFA